MPSNACFWIISIQIKYDCAFESQFTLTYGTGLNVAMTTVEMDIGGFEASFDVAFALFEDDKFLSPIQGKNSNALKFPKK